MGAGAVFSNLHNLFSSFLCPLSYCSKVSSIFLEKHFKGHRRRKSCIPLHNFVPHFGSFEVAFYFILLHNPLVFWAVIFILNQFLIGNNKAFHSVCFKLFFSPQTQDSCWCQRYFYHWSRMCFTFTTWIQNVQLFIS